MADNVSILDGSADLIDVAADEIGGVKYQRVKLAHGVDGAAVDASGTNPFPIEVHAESGGAMVPIAAAHERVGLLVDPASGSATHSITGAFHLVPAGGLTGLKYGDDPIPCVTVRVKSLKANDEGTIVYAGNESSANYALDPGESVDVAATDVRDVYVYMTTGAADVCWIATVLENPANPAPAKGWLDWQDF